MTRGLGLVLGLTTCGLGLMSSLQAFLTTLPAPPWTIPILILYFMPMQGGLEQCFTSPPTQYRLYGRRFL